MKQPLIHSTLQHAAIITRGPHQSFADFEISDVDSVEADINPDQQLCRVNDCIAGLYQDPVEQQSHLQRTYIEDRTTLSNPRDHWASCPIIRAVAADKTANQNRAHGFKSSSVTAASPAAHHARHISTVACKNGVLKTSPTLGLTGRHSVSFNKA